MFYLILLFLTNYSNANEIGSFHGSAYVGLHPYSYTDLYIGAGLGGSVLIHKFNRWLAPSFAISESFSFYSTLLGSSGSIVSSCISLQNTFQLLLSDYFGIDIIPAIGYKKDFDALVSPNYIAFIIAPRVQLSLNRTWYFIQPYFEYNREIFVDKTDIYVSNYKNGFYSYEIGCCFGVILFNHKK